MLKVYYKANCATCQTALSLIRKNSKEKIEKTEYLVDVPSEKEIREILKLLEIKAEELVRKKEPVYKKKFEGKRLTEKEWIQVMIKNPILIDRPIVIKDNKAIIGRPAEKVLELFGKS
jgi:arsenate reductase